MKLSKGLIQMRVTKRRLSEMRDFLKHFNVSMAIIPHGESSNADIEGSHIEIERNPLNVMWGHLFHELCHIICAREGKFPLYHSMNQAKTREHKLAIRRTGLRAEVYVDKMAEKLFNSYLPDLKYEKNYRTWTHRAWHQAWLEAMFK